MAVSFVIAWLLLAISVAAAAYWAAVFVRVGMVMRERPTVRAGEGLPLADAPKVSVIVPAHNEERVIDACCASLRAQDYPNPRNLEFIFVLDRCTDRTAAIVRRHAAEDDRIIVIENDTCPPDWAGKCNAARIGAERATGDYLLFTDADTQFDPALCRAAVAITNERDLALLSLLSTLTFRYGFERIAQPVATMHLMRLYPPKRWRSGVPARPFANGQFMLFPRPWYEKIGGHQAVKDDLLEDLAFAELVHHHGGRVNALLADGMLRCSMYDSLAQFTEGWKRIFIEACRRRPARLRKNARRILLSGVAMPLVQVATLIVAAVLVAAEERTLPTVMITAVLAGWVIQFATLARVYTIGGAPAWAAIYYPIGSWIVARAVFEGARDLVRRRPVRWGGREYVLEPREAG